MDAKLSKLKELFLAAIDDVINIAKSQKYGNFPIVQHVVEWWVFVNPNQSRMHRELITEGDYYLFQAQFNKLFEGCDAINELQKIAFEYFDTNGIFFVYGITKDGLLPQISRLLLKTYFDEVKEFKKDVNVAEEVIDKIVLDFSKDEGICETILHIEDFDASEPFALNEFIKFRRIDRKDFIRHHKRHRGGFLAAYSKINKPLKDKDWICEIKHPVKKDDNRGFDTSAMVENIILSLSLITDKNAKFCSILNTVTPTIFGHGIDFGGNIIQTNRGVEPVYIDEKNQIELKNMYNLILELKQKQKLKEVEFALRRLRLSSEKTDIGDYLVDCVIGLENLLVIESAGEVSYRFRLRGSAILPNNFGSVPERMSLLKKLYDKRSQVVHGNKDALKNIEDDAKNAASALRSVLLWYLHTGIKNSNKKQIIEKLDVSLATGGQIIRDSTF